MVKINTEVLVKALILLGFSLFFITIILNGSVQLYVHPRIIPYMKFGTAAMVLIAIYIMKDVFKPDRKKRSLYPYLFMIIPLFTAFALPAKPMNSGSLLAKDVNISQNSNSFSKNNKPDDLNQTAVDASKLDTLPLNEKNTIFQPKKPLLQGDTIIINEKNYVEWIQELYNNTDAYEGKKVQISGFVFREKDFNENVFVTARYMMSCCTADAQITGLYSLYPKAYELKQDTWLKVSGKIKQAEYKGQLIPSVEVGEMERIDKPKNEYIYSN